MFNRKMLLCCVSLLFFAAQSFLVAQQNPSSGNSALVTWDLSHLNLEGYYKHALLNGGPGVDPPPNSHFTELGLTYETVDPDECTSHLHSYANLFIGSPIDRNGMLFYPDGANRFAMMVVGGAAAEEYENDDCSQPLTGSWIGGGGRFSDFLKDNWNDMGQTGRHHFHKFMSGGGAYSGFCAGSSLMETAALNITNYNEVGLINANDWLFNRTGDQLVPYVGNLTAFQGVRSLGGGTLFENPNPPQGAEVIYYASGNALPESDDVPATPHLPDFQYVPLVWSWDNPNRADWGRMVVSGAHPELGSTSEAFALTAAMYSYALEGSGRIHIKENSLNNGATRSMNQDTGGDPQQTKIGDKQIHHFTLDPIGSGNRYLLVELEGALADQNEEVYDFRLYLNRDRPAFPSDHLYMGGGSLSNKTIYLENLPDLANGTWYVGVELFTTVELETNTWGEQRYVGRTEVLNGIAYDLTATWSNGPIHVCDELVENVTIASSVAQNTNTTISWTTECIDNSDTVKVELLTSGGALIRTLTTSVPANSGTFDWFANQSTGSYRIRVTANHDPNLFALSNSFTVVETPADPFIRVSSKGSLANGTLYIDDCKPGSTCTRVIYLTNTGDDYRMVGATVRDNPGHQSYTFLLSSPDQVIPFVPPFPAQMFMGLDGRRTAKLIVSFPYNYNGLPSIHTLELQGHNAELEYETINLCVNCR
ncbi:hypothetical protein [Acanthopleuribacter pedis]|uniref:Uncharacterized protein n=1 Tax=Acanthopleuribacter pedis TaxID=442870 RepID=A0A8J7QF54_9BACT|nr:hypothetical protein [Acanthopleuribacter pedis]MBO1323169.1 hypothetical protein [Acanthopleuribacter pedis]